MGRMRRYLVFLLGGLALLALAACDGGGGGGSTTPTVEPGTDPASVPSATPFGSEAIRYQVTGSGETTTGSPFTGANVASGPSSGPSINAGTGEYIVQPGDSFFSIAGQFGITLDELLDLNDMTADTPIFPGDVLRVPGDDSPGGSVTATPSGTPAEGESTPEPGGGGGSTYTVAEGDSCASIAAAFGVTAAEIIAANGLPAECNTLQIGQQLTIP
jgi:LysM repeat protein